MFHPAIPKPFATGKFGLLVTSTMKGFTPFDHDLWSLPQELTALPGLAPGHCHRVNANCGCCLLLMVPPFITGAPSMISTVVCPLPPFRLWHARLHLGCKLVLGVALTLVEVLARTVPLRSLLDHDPGVIFLGWCNAGACRCSMPCLCSQHELLA